MLELFLEIIDFLLQPQNVFDFLTLVHMAFVLLDHFKIIKFVLELLIFILEQENFFLLFLLGFLKFLNDRLKLLSLGPFPILAFQLLLKLLYSVLLFLKDFLLIFKSLFHFRHRLVCLLNRCLGIFKKDLPILNLSL